jgi:hypothetical protein
MYTKELLKLQYTAFSMWGVQDVRSPNFFFSSGMEVGRNVKVVGDDVAVL